jgi:hypothetical protein
MITGAHAIIYSIAQMATHKVACSAVQSMGWGLLAQVTLPGGGKLGVYQPRHGRP